MKQLTPAFTLRKFHGQRSLTSYCPKGRKESDATARAHRQLIYNVVLVPDNNKVILIYIYILFQVLFPYRLLQSPVLTGFPDVTVLKNLPAMWETWV